MQGNRVKESSFRDEACEEVVVPCGGFALQAHGAFCGGVSHQVARQCGFIVVKLAGRDPCGRGIRRRGKPCPSPNGGYSLRPMIADEWPENTRQQQ